MLLARRACGSAAAWGSKRSVLALAMGFIASATPSAQERATEAPGSEQL